MDHLLRSTLLKLALPVGVSLLLLAVLRRRSATWRADLGLRWPAPRAAALWGAVWVAWAAAVEVAIVRLGLEQAEPWPDFPALVVALRVAAIGLAGPFMEELLMRGVLLQRLRATRLGAAGAVVVVAAAWAALHWSYGPSTLGIIFLDGLLLGAVRVRSGSLLLCWALHAAGNLFSIGQSLHA